MNSNPFQVILVVVFLYMELGVSALAGVLFLILLVPVNSYGGKKIEECQVRFAQ